MIDASGCVCSRCTRSKGKIIVRSTRAGKGWETLPCVDVETERCEDRVSRRTGRLTPTVVLDSIEVPLTGISALERGVGMASPTRVLVPVDEGLLEMPKETLFCEELKRCVERVERRTGG